MAAKCAAIHLICAKSANAYLIDAKCAIFS